MHRCAAFFLVFGAAGAACESGSTMMPEPNDGHFGVFPSKVWVGADDAGHGFSAPLAAMAGTGIRWISNSPAFRVMGDDEGAMVTAVTPGHGEIVATAADGQTATVPVVVRSYTISSIQNGQMGFMTIGCNRSGCHDAHGPNITPSGISKYDDLPLDYWITMGKSLDGTQTVQFHQWNESTGLSLADQMGIVAFLRSQPPQGSPTPK